MSILGTLVFYLHILGAALWIGPQVMMFAVVVPSLRAVKEESVRVQILRALAPRLGWLGGFALTLLIATGIYNVFYRMPADPFDYRYGYMLSLKMGLVAVIGLLTVAHSFAVGPRLLALQEAALGEDVEESEIRPARLRSVLVSSLTLLLSLFVLLIAVFLRSSFAYQPL